MVAAAISMRRGPAGEAPAAGPAPNGVAWAAGGGFGMGSHQPQFLDARPVHRVRVDGFCIEETAVTDSQFEAFVPPYYHLGFCCGKDATRRVLDASYSRRKV